MLEGKVGDFSLPEIFQLIALTKKTGTLTISTGQHQGRVRFRDGEVNEAASDVRKLALGARLVAAGLVDESQLAAALETKRDQGGDVLRLLLEHAAIDEGALHAFVREQIADAVADMLRFEDASFRFDSEDQPAEPLIDLHVATDQLVAEGNQRLAEWEAIRQHVPSSDTVFAIAPVPSVDGAEVAVDGDDWQILALVDGRRAVSEIVELSGRSEFGTSKALAGLAGRRLVEACRDDDDGHPLSTLLARREVLRRLEELELSEARTGPPRPAPDTERSEPEPASQEDHTTPEVAAPPTGETGAESTRETGAEPAGETGAEPSGETGEEPLGETGAEPGEREAADGPDGGTVPPAPSFEEEGAPADPGALTDRDALVESAALSEPATGGSDDGGAGAAGFPGATIDRAQVARELAALGLDDLGEGAPAARPASHQEPEAAGEQGVDGTEQVPAGRRLVRDEELNKGLLLRLIDGVKGA